MSDQVPPSSDDAVASLEEVVSRVPGWLTPAEGRLLYELAKRTPRDACIVEIGSWQGKSTLWLAAGARSGHGAPVVAIDPHRGSALHGEGGDTEAALRANLDSAGLGDLVEVVVATSKATAERWARPIALLWIDGDHEYSSVREDFLLWEPHLVDRGTVALHDTLYWEGPARVVSEFLERSRNFTDLAFVDSITCATRQRSPSLGQVMRKRTAILHRRIYAIRAGAAPNPLRPARAIDALAKVRRRLGRGA